jgi:hypothetical protein
MAKVASKPGQPTRPAQTNKYDANNTVLTKTYGALADLRRELADSKAAVAERTELLKLFAECADSQRAWLLLEDYFEKLSLSRRDFASLDWWPRVLAARSRARIEELALLFLRTGRSVPTELMAYANFDRLAELQQAEQDEVVVRELENWLAPRAPLVLDAPRALLRVICQAQPLVDQPTLHGLRVTFQLSRPRNGEQERSGRELLELHHRAHIEQKQFSAADWEFIEWFASLHKADAVPDALELGGVDLLRWLARWGHTPRLENAEEGGAFRFGGDLAELVPHLEIADAELLLTTRLKLANGPMQALSGVRFFGGEPPLAAVGSQFYILRSRPSAALLGEWAVNPAMPVKKLSHRLLVHLRQHGPRGSGDWGQLCHAHQAVPQFIFELADDTLRLRLLARSERDQSVWQWDGHEWQSTGGKARPTDKPEVLDDPRLEAATAWLRRLDWFTPEPGLWIGDTNPAFLNSLALAWQEKPPGAEFLGNPAFQRLFMARRPLRPKLIIGGSGIDWFTVSAAWEQEGMKLTPADLKALQTATGRFVKLPDSGWVELDAAAVRDAHETIADLGLEGLSAVGQQVSFMQAKQLEDGVLQRFADQPIARQLRERLADFHGIAPTPLPEQLKAEMRPYQKAGFDFLCHLWRLKLGGVLADDMGLGKTLQTLSWLAHLHASGGKARPALVICPASVLHNWRREAEKFTPHLKVLVLESGAARHNLRKQIPQHDIIVTNYALLRRDLEALQKFEFRAVILDEAQFIKNPSAQVTQAVKELKAEIRLALTGTPLENRLLDLWSIIDFVQPGYLGTQSDFSAEYDPRGEDAAWAQKIARRRLSARLRPLMLRRLKRQVAQDLPDRIEERRDCELGEPQRKLYLAELRRSREQVMQTVASEGLAKSKIHVLAALTRLRQICCHPQLVGNDSVSGKTETLFELLEPLLADGQKVLIFSQFVQMLRLLETECARREIKTHILTGETKNRQETVNAFQSDPGGGVFLLSLRAAGTGLNLTNASYVVLYDPWWNPAVEAQAIDRSHRIGQTRNVFAYRLIAPGTVEEKIWDLQQRKAQTISDVLGEEGFARSLTKADLEYLFSED